MLTKELADKLRQMEACPPFIDRTSVMLTREEIAYLLALIPPFPSA